jgi:hypothetical protein
MIGAIVAGTLSEPVAPVTNSYESIATVTVGAGGQSSISFTSIPSTFKHLQIRALVKDNRSATEFDNNFIRFNNDSGSNYYSHQLSGNGSSASAFNLGPETAAIYATAPGGSIGASIFNGVVIDILDYASTNKTKVTRSLNGFDSNSVGTVRLVSSLWNSTAAINRIDLITNVDPASTIQQYSSYALYGIKG